MKKRIVKNELIVKRAWIVVWEWCGEHAKKDKEIISFFDYRIDEKKIALFIEKIYANSEYTLDEQLLFLKYPRKNPYKAQYDMGIITCGHNPWVSAEMVLNLRIENGGLVYDKIFRTAIREEIRRREELALKQIER